MHTWYKRNLLVEMRLSSHYSTREKYAFHLQLLQKLSDGWPSKGFDLCPVQSYDNVWFPITASDALDTHQPLGILQEDSEDHVAGLHVSLKMADGRKG